MEDFSAILRHLREASQAEVDWWACLVLLCGAGIVVLIGAAVAAWPYLPRRAK